MEPMNCTARVTADKAEAWAPTQNAEASLAALSEDCRDILDRFFTRTDPVTGLVEVGPRYSVDSQLRIFSPRDPGEPIDGIGQYLYPAQFAGPKKP